MNELESTLKITPDMSSNYDIPPEVNSAEYLHKMMVNAYTSNADCDPHLTQQFMLGMQRQCMQHISTLVSMQNIDSKKNELDRITTDANINSLVEFLAGLGVSCGVVSEQISESKQYQKFCF